MTWAAGKAAIDGILLGSAAAVEVGSVAVRHIVSEKYRLDNPYDRLVLAEYIVRFVARQAESVVEQEPARAAAGKGGPA